jgi:hypothetical protein
MTAVWRRDHYTFGGGRGQIALVALGNVALPDPLPVSRRQHGMPTCETAAEIGVVSRERLSDPAWFTDALLAPFAGVVADDLGADAAATALAATHAYIIEGELDDPDDLGYVQAAWALAKCVAELGATIVVDVLAARAYLGSEVAGLSPDRPFDVMNEVTLFFDEQPDDTVGAWTLGLRKFGRADLVLRGLAPGDTSDAALLLRDLAATLAAGERVEPGDEIMLPDGRRLTVATFDPVSAPGIKVDGAALLLSVAPPLASDEPATTLAP